MKSLYNKPLGWRNESHRHYLAGKGIKTNLYAASKTSKLLDAAIMKGWKAGEDIDDERVSTKNELNERFYQDGGRVTGAGRSEDAEFESERRKEAKNKFKIEGLGGDFDFAKAGDKGFADYLENLNERNRAYGIYALTENVSPDKTLLDVRFESPPDYPDYDAQLEDYNEAAVEEGMRARARSLGELKEIDEVKKKINLALASQKASEANNSIREEASRRIKEGAYDKATYDAWHYGSGPKSAGLRAEDWLTSSGEVRSTPSRRRVAVYFNRDGSQKEY